MVPSALHVAGPPAPPLPPPPQLLLPLLLLLDVPGVQKPWHCVPQSLHAHVYQLFHSPCAFCPAAFMQFCGQPPFTSAHLLMQLFNVTQTESFMQFLACEAQSLPVAVVAHV
jgi:hypothetical protein